MLRFVEIGLFLLPFVVFAAWRVAGGGVPSVAFLAWTLGFVAVVAAALTWLASHDTLGPGERYVPARIEDGRIVPGHGS